MPNPKRNICGYKARQSFVRAVVASQTSLSEQVYDHINATLSLSSKSIKAVLTG